jgi:hypothetical protein
MRQNEEPLDEAERLARELADYEERDDEITNNVHVHLDSKPDSDPPAKKQIAAGLIALGSGIGLALIGGLATLLQRCGK